MVHIPLKNKALPEFPLSYPESTTHLNFIAQTFTMVRMRSPRKHQPLIVIQARDYGSVQRAILRSRHRAELWYAETKLPLTQEQIESPWTWDSPPRKYDLALLFPRFDAKTMTLARITENHYVKEQDLLKHGLSAFEAPWRRDITLREIEMCELLSQHPHPNVCQYRGVVSEGGRVISLVFDRYDMNLSQALRRGHKIDEAKCLRDINCAVEHFHSLGLVHGDVKAENVFVNIATQQFCLGDFDAVHREGAHLTLRTGTPGWTPEYEETDQQAAKEIDLYSMEMLRMWLDLKCHYPGGLLIPDDFILSEARRLFFGITDDLARRSSRSEGSIMDTSRSECSAMDMCHSERSEMNTSD